MLTYRALRGEVQRAALGLSVVAGAAMLVLLGAHYVSAVHEARAARARVCTAELAALAGSVAFVERYLKPADPCLALDVVRGGRP